MKQIQTSVPNLAYSIIGWHAESPKARINTGVVRLFLAVQLVLFSLTLIRAQISGQVVDEQGQALVGAEITLVDTKTQTVTDAKGKWSFPDRGVNDSMKVSYIGYATRYIELEAWHNGARIQLAPSVEILELIQVTEEHAKQEVSLSAIHLNQEFLAQHSRSTLAASLDVLPGISAINVGTGIAKPVIRGLYGNRVLVNINGVKQEGQQWGNDHGLEVDPMGIEQIEIVKGPSALQYGSDAMGGVINILPAAIPRKQGVSGGFRSIYQTNNRQLGLSAHLKVRRNKAFLITRVSRQQFQDFRVPASSFTYNDFTLPIVNEQVKNTAGLEENVHLAAGWQGKRMVHRISAKQYYLRSGLFSGAVGIPRSYLLQDDGNPSDIALPYQEVRHRSVRMNHTFIWGDHHWIINAGWQENLREEHSNPEFHSVPSSQLNPNETVSVGLRLQTWSLNTHYEWKVSSIWDINLGANAQYQTHEREGFSHLLPDYKTWRSGLFFISNYQWHPDWILHGGVRLDLARNQSDRYVQQIFSSNEVILDSLVSPFTKDYFFNWSLAIGTQWDINKHWLAKVNIARAFRIPYPNETVSNGVHHGTFRHEQGTPDLRTEIGWQMDVSTQASYQRFRIQLDGYLNLFQNYIYLRPTARFSPLPEAGQLFRFVQNDAIYTGLEGTLSYEWNQWLVSSCTVEGIYNLNLDERIPLPFTPPWRTDLELQWRMPTFWQLSNMRLGIRYQYSFAQNRVDRNERRTPGYDLVDLSWQVERKWRGHLLRLDVQCQNVWNAFYLRHLSRYRFLSLPEQGRNFVVRVQYSL